MQSGNRAVDATSKRDGAGRPWGKEIDVDVLIAHESERSRAALAAALDSNDFTFIEASDGSSALELLMQDDPPRLALIDWDLPDVEGPELCRILRDFHLGRPPYVILLTPERPGRDIKSGLVAGASDFVCTPASGTELRARVEFGVHVVESPRGRRGEDDRREAPPEAAGGRAELSAMLTNEWASVLGA
jgi:DNA-binding response OmpR family regulator